MKYLILTLIILSFGLLNAEKVDITPLTGRVISNQPDGYVGTNLPTTPELSAMAKDFESAMARRDIPTAKMIDRQMSKIRENLIPKREISPAELGNRQAGFVKQGFSGSLPFLWGNDVQIDSSNIWAFGAAGDTNGTMWCAVALRPESTIHVFRSTDHGINWSYVYWMTHGSDFRKVEVVVGSGDSNYVYVFYIRRTAGGDLWCFRIKTDLSGHNFYPVAVGPDTIDDFSVSIDYVDWYYLYCIYANEHRTGLTSHITRSLDMGATWETPVDWWNAWDPCIAYGSDGSVHCCWQFAVSRTAIDYQHNRNYGNPAYWEGYDRIYDGNDTVWNPVLTQANTEPDTEAVVWGLYTHNYNNTGDWDVDYGYNQAGGNPGQWNRGNHLSWTSQDEWYPDIRHYYVSPNSYVNACYNLGGTGTTDSTVIYWRWVNAPSPTNWSDPVKVSDQRVTTTTEGANPKLVYSPHSPGTGSGVVFAYWGPEGVYFDANWLNIGITEKENNPKITRLLNCEPNPFRNKLIINYSIPSLSNAELKIFDIAGREVKSLVSQRLPYGNYSVSWDGTDNTGKKQGAGIYLIKLKVDNSEAVEKLILTR